MWLFTFVFVSFLKTGSHCVVLTVDQVGLKFIEIYLPLPPKRLKCVALISATGIPDPGSLLSFPFLLKQDFSTKF